MLSQYLIGPGFVPQRLPQQKATETKKSVLIGSHTPPPPVSIVGSTGTLTAPVPGQIATGPRRHETEIAAPAPELPFGKGWITRKALQCARDFAIVSPANRASLHCMGRPRGKRS